MDEKSKQVTGDEAFTKMARICSQKECAPIDIARRLRRMELPEPEVHKVIDRLKIEKYLDEKRFIRSFIHDKLQFNQWGKRKIELALKLKVLPHELVEEGLSEIKDEYSFDESLQAILEKKWKNVKGKSDYEKKGKLMRFALGRGFSMDEVMAAIEKIQNEMDRIA